MHMFVTRYLSPRPDAVNSKGGWWVHQHGKCIPWTINTTPLVIGISIPANSNQAWFKQKQPTNQMESKERTMHANVHWTPGKEICGASRSTRSKTPESAWSPGSTQSHSHGWLAHSISPFLSDQLYLLHNTEGDTQQLPILQITITF